MLPEVETRPPGRPRHGPARRARPGQDPADPLPRSACSTSGRRSSPGSELNEHPLRPICRAAGPRRRRARATTCRSPGCTARPLRREARHARHQRRRPGRRRRPDQGGRGPHARRPGDHPLRPGAAHQPRHLRRQRAARPRRAHPGRLLNVLEERDIQVRGYQLRLPLDLLLVASANPEDYTNRGRIITPLKDRFGAEIRTHYPLDLDLEIALVAQEADAGRRRARPPARGARPVRRGLRESSAVDQRSGVSARFAIAAAETRAASALRRGGAARRGRRRSPGSATCRRAADAARQGRVRERRGGPRGRGPRPPAAAGRSPATFRDRLAGLDLSGFTELVADGDDRRDRRARAGRRRCCAGRHRAGAGRGARPARPRRGPCRPGRSPRRSSSCSRACT